MSNRQPIVKHFFEPLRHGENGRRHQNRSPLLAPRPDLQVDRVDLRIFGVVAPNRPDFGTKEIHALRIRLAVTVGTPGLESSSGLWPLSIRTRETRTSPPPGRRQTALRTSRSKCIPHVRLVDAIVRPVADHGIAQAPRTDAVSFRVDAPADPFAFDVVLTDVGASCDKQDFGGDFAKVARAPWPGDERRFSEAARRQPPEFIVPWLRHHAIPPGDISRPVLRLHARRVVFRPLFDDIGERPP